MRARGCGAIDDLRMLETTPEQDRDEHDAETGVEKHENDLPGEPLSRCRSFMTGCERGNLLQARSRNIAHLVRTIKTLLRVDDRLKILACPLVLSEVMQQNSQAELM